MTVLPETSTTTLPDGGVSHNYGTGPDAPRIVSPPAGFDAATATAAQRVEYSLPARPRSPLAAERVDAQLSTLRFAAAPPFLTEAQLSTGAVRNRGARPGVHRFTNWAGHVELGPHGTFTHVKAAYVEPKFRPSRCKHNDEVTWAGLGGYHDGPLGQDGTSFGPSLGSHQAWYAVVPKEGALGLDVFARPGDRMYVSTSWNRKRHAYHGTVIDMTRHQASPWLQYVKPRYFAGGSAEAIVERPLVGHPYHLPNLSDFGTVRFTMAATGRRTFTQRRKPRKGVRMVGHTGLLAVPHKLKRHGAFTVSYKACR